jgi:hypothetical protein
VVGRGGGSRACSVAVGRRTCSAVDIGLLTVRFAGEVAAIPATAAVSSMITSAESPTARMSFSARRHWQCVANYTITNRYIYS